MRLDTPTARTDVRSSNSSSETRKSAFADEISGLPCDSSQQSYRLQSAANPAVLPATITNRKIAMACLPRVLNVDTEYRVSNVNEATPRRKSDGAVRPFEVYGLQLNPDIKPMATKAQIHQQQSTIADADDNSKTHKSASATSSSSCNSASGPSTAAKCDLSLPLSRSDNEDDDDDDQETTDYRYSGTAGKMSIGGSVGCDTPAIMEGSCPILSVRIEYCKSHTEQNDAYIATPATTMQSDSGCSCSGDGRGRRQRLGRTPHKTNAKTASKPTSPSKAISVVGRGKVVVIDDGVYDKFARRHPPKYVTNRKFDAVLNKQTFNK